MLLLLPFPEYLTLLMLCGIGPHFKHGRQRNTKGTDEMWRVDLAP
jgi:hypothetical protein